MSSADKQVIDMVNKPHERQAQLLARSKAAKRARERKAREKAHRASAMGMMLRFAIVLELAIIVLALGFIVVAG